MTESNLRDRRFRSWDPSLQAGTRPCRVCLRVVAVGRDAVETTLLHVYARCPECGGSFPIRHSDVEALPGATDATAGGGDAVVVEMRRGPR
jgi:hypothetical protein